MARRKNKVFGVPALLCFVVPGLGQLVKGHIGKALVLFVGTLLGMFAYIIPGVLIWVFNIYDAYNSDDEWFR